MLKTHGIAHALENGQKKRASSATLEEETKEPPPQTSELPHQQLWL
jgi:hypothetical protein